MFYSDLNFDSTVRNSKTTDSIFMNDRYNLSDARLVFLLIFDYPQLLLSVSILKFKQVGSSSCSSWKPFTNVWTDNVVIWTDTNVIWTDSNVVRVSNIDHGNDFWFSSVNNGNKNSAPYLTRYFSLYWSFIDVTRSKFMVKLTSV